MNLVLYDKHEITPENTLVLTDRRHLHLKNILKIEPEQIIQVGEMDNELDEAQCLQVEADFTTLKLLNHKQNPPPPLNAKVIVAMARPKMLKRILTTLAMMGVKEIHLIHSYNVEKSYWGSPLLQSNQYLDYFLRGLEQSKDTLLPKLYVHKRFKPFVEDIAPQIALHTKAFVAHLDSNHEIARSAFNNQEMFTFAIGPERGFTNYEVQKFNEIGYKTLSLGPRVLRTEVFIPCILGQLYTQSHEII